LHIFLVILSSFGADQSLSALRLHTKIDPESKSSNIRHPLIFKTSFYRPILARPLSDQADKASSHNTAGRSFCSLSRLPVLKITHL
jgi:hypothetical protein